MLLYETVPQVMSLTILFLRLFSFLHSCILFFFSSISYSTLSLSLLDSHLSISLFSLYLFSLSSLLPYLSVCLCIYLFSCGYQPLLLYHCFLSCRLLHPNLHDALSYVALAQHAYLPPFWKWGHIRAPAPRPKQTTFS